MMPRWDSRALSVASGSFGASGSALPAVNVRPGAGLQVGLHAELLLGEGERLGQRRGRRRAVARGVDAVDPACTPRRKQLDQAQVVVEPAVGDLDQRRRRRVHAEQLPEQIAQPADARQPGLVPGPRPRAGRRSGRPGSASTPRAAAGDDEERLVPGGPLAADRRGDRRATQRDRALHGQVAPQPRRREPLQSSPGQ